MERLTKNFPVFDCDAHIMDPETIWAYVPESQKELAMQAHFVDTETGVTYINGKPIFTGSREAQRTIRQGYPVATVKGPQMTNQIVRRLMDSGQPLNEEQWDYLDHEGAYDPRARVADLDLMGIDQVLVVPTMMITLLMAVEFDPGMNVVAQAYNNWLKDWCGEAADRLFGAAILPQFDAADSAAEIYRCAELGHPVCLVRPIDARGAYPNAVPEMQALIQNAMGNPSTDAMFRAFEETQVCLGMHTFPAQTRGEHEPGRFVSPNEYLANPDTRGASGDFRTFTLGFIYEAQTWLGQVLLSGFLDRYSKLKMLIFESNSQWLPYLLERCDRLFKLYRNERSYGAKRLPSEAFYEQCAISFESDDIQTQRQWRQFEDIGIWASDAYHHDAADAWSGIREMRRIGVPEDVQVKLMGLNACNFYGIEPKLFVTEEPDPIDRPAWFPKQDADFDTWATLIKHPRENAAELRAIGWEPKARVGRGAAY